MRTSLRYLLLTAGAASLLGLVSCDEYLGNINEGLNIHDLGGKVLIPKSQAPNGLSDIGVLYVGVYSGLDQSLGFYSPVAAPAGVGGGDTFPYGGTSVGDFQTTDVRYICFDILHRTVIDAGANYEIDFSILQFPFFKGSAIWAFVDNGNRTCDPNGGLFDQFSFPVAPGANASVTPAPADWQPSHQYALGDLISPSGNHANGGQFYRLILLGSNHGISGTTEPIWPTNPNLYGQTKEIEQVSALKTMEWRFEGHTTGAYDTTLAPTDISFIYAPATNATSGLLSVAFPRGAGDPGLQLVDAIDHYYDVEAFISTNGTDPVLRVHDFYGYGKPPVSTGFFQPLIVEAALGVTYGSQSEDVLNHPAKYLQDGDFTVSSPTVLDSPQSVTLTLDHVIVECGGACQ